MAKRQRGERGTVAADLYDQPGHLIRRAHQISVAAYSECVSREVTPLQYAILRMVHEKPGIDQVTLARLIGLDNSTTALTAARLQTKGLLLRETVPTDRRQLRLSLSAEGEHMIQSLVTNVHRMREQLLGSLDADERELLMQLLRKFVRLNNEQSPAPLRREATNEDG
ncbi:MAG: MarR family transcriptional regulator [Burkholderiales bacterium]|nr:MarR family transcriptional regulator [Burkholderiales bacterium]MDE2394730.1 MarR family transcriptional regulator [Burkholderiales bacterium]MDE2456177.1 MarR family transcriptional regulator [Burkholderiales bacterium]